MGSGWDRGFPAGLTAHATCLTGGRTDSRPTCLPLGWRLLSVWLGGSWLRTGLGVALIGRALLGTALISGSLLGRTLLVAGSLLRGAALRPALTGCACGGTHSRPATAPKRPTASGPTATAAGRKAGGPPPIRAARRLLGLSLIHI